MSLRWDVAQCNKIKWENLNESWKEALIFATVGVGIGQITKTNAPKFYARMKFMGIKDVTPQIVDAAIGLRTNVTEETDSQFLKKFQNDLRSFEWEYNHKLERQTNV